MKKIILISLIIFTALAVNGQTFYKNVTVQKSAPTLYLNGTGAKIDFYNGDVTLTQSSNILTLGGANYFKVGTDTIATRDYARSYGGTGTVTFDDVQEEIADSLNVLRPLVLMIADTATMLADYALTSEVGVTIGDVLMADSTDVFATPTQLSDSLGNYVQVADTASMLTNYALTSELPAAGVSIGDVRNEIADSLNVLRPLYVAVSDTATMLANYALTSEVGTGDVALSDSLTVFVTPTQLSDSLDAIGGGVSIGDVRDEIADSLNVLRPLYVAVADTATMLTNYSLTSEVRIIINDSIDARIGAGTELSDVAVMLADSLTQWVTISQLVDSLAAFSGGLTSGEVATQINDTITARLSVAIEGLRLADSLTVWVTPTQLVDSMQAIAGGLVIGDVRDEIADSLNVLRDDILSENDLRKFDSDTIPLFTFGAGSGGLESDTALFTTSNIYGAFYNTGSDTLIVTNLRAVMIAGTTPLGTDTLSIQVYWNDTINVTLGNSFTVLNTNPLGITSTTVGTIDTSFDNNAIPPGRWVWCKTPGVVTGRKPKALIVQLSGFKRNRSY